MRDTDPMHGAFAIVVIAVGVVGVLGALATLLSGRRTWEDYGRGHLLKDSDGPIARRGRTRGVTPGDAGAPDGERDDEIRQMLQAANVRRRRRGEPERDVGAELERVTRAAVGPEVDDELRGEIRELVLARHRRRARRAGSGSDPPPTAADVEAEVRREIARLSER